jgi:zeaxanthin glucosyltransferase
MTALARKLQSRGHDVVFIGVPDIEPVVRAANLDFAPFCEIAETGVNALILDSVYLLLEIVPLHLRLPYVQIWNVLHFDFSGSTPLTLYGWPHETSPEALARNAAGLQILSEFRGPLMPVAQSYAERNGLEIDWGNPAATVSKLAVITQTPKEFDFPIPHLPAQFHYAGPFHDDEGREPIPFPWEKLTGKLLIYASLGTLVNGLNNVYRTILEAVSEFPEMQVVLSIGRNLDPGDLGPIPSNRLLVTKSRKNQKLLSKTSALTAWPGTTKVHEVDRRMNKSCN